MPRIVSDSGSGFRARFPRPSSLRSVRPGCLALCFGGFHPGKLGQRAGGLAGSGCGWFSAHCSTSFSSGHPSTCSKIVGTGFPQSGHRVIGVWFLEARKASRAAAASFGNARSSLAADSSAMDFTHSSTVTPGVLSPHWFHQSRAASSSDSSISIFISKGSVGIDGEARSPAARVGASHAEVPQARPPIQATPCARHGSPIEAPNSTDRARFGGSWFSRFVGFHAPRRMALNRDSITRLYSSAADGSAIIAKYPGIFSPSKS